MKNGLEVNENGTKYWYKDWKLHREDGPAVERLNGDKRWYKDGKLHRDNGPAIELANGNKWWYRNGGYYREDNLPHWEGPCWKKWFYKDKWYDSFEEYMLAKVVG